MRGPNWAWYWPWEDWAVHKPPPPPTWDLIRVDLADKAAVFFGSQKIPGLRWEGLLGVLGGLVSGAGLLGAYFIGGMLLPKAVTRDIPFKKALSVTAVLCLVSGILAKVGHTVLFRFDFIGRNMPHFGLPQILCVAFFLFVAVVLGFLLPQKYLRTSKGLSLVQYVTTMSLLLMMLGVVIKIGARLGFNVKYIFSLPGLNFNI